MARLAFISSFVVGTRRLSFHGGVCSVHKERMRRGQMTLRMGLLPFSSVAEAEQVVEQAVEQVQQSSDDTFTKVLAIIAFGSLIWITIGTIIISVDAWLLKRNEEREIKEFEAARVNKKPGAVVKPAGTREGPNREYRRIEKKVKEQEEKAKKRREARKKDQS